MSLPTQEKQCREFCDPNGWEVDQVFVEQGESAKTTDRPQFQAMLAHCRESKGRIQYVVVYSVNRFARDKHDHYVIRALLSGVNITLRSVTEAIDDSSTGRFIEGVLAAVAQFDNDVRSERTIAGIKAQLERGQWTFQPPLRYRNSLGYSGGVRLERDPERAPLIEQAFEMMATGASQGRRFAGGHRARSKSL